MEIKAPPTRKKKRIFEDELSDGGEILRRMTNANTTTSTV